MAGQLVFSPTTGILPACSVGSKTQAAGAKLISYMPDQTCAYFNRVLEQVKRAGSVALRSDFGSPQAGMSKNRCLRVSPASSQAGSSPDGLRRGARKQYSV